MAVQASVAVAAYEKLAFSQQLVSETAVCCVVQNPCHVTSESRLLLVSSDFGKIE